MLTLYHGDTAVCAAKVRVTLAEKGIPWEGKRIDLGRGDQFDPEYLKLNPNGVVPTLVHDGNVLIESTVINEYLDEAFPEKPLRPEGAYLRARLRLWTKREDSIHYAINTMTTAIIFRPELLKKTKEQQAARIDGIPDPSRRAKFHELMETGLESKSVTDALVAFARLFRDMEKALASGPWLMGAPFTLADSGLISFFYRMEMLQIAGIWTEHFPRVAAWFERCRARPSFTEAIERHIPAAAHDSYRAAGTPTWPIVRAKFAQVLTEI
ncbi:MAG: glutathione S-transferase family protein [Rhodospirillales bacterium]|jgi:glutathione S-transferase|nr:glutathione S-transferase family protein [Rhodospirillales bacterium]